jgi:hypothetical protein
MMKRLALVAIALFFCATLSGWNHLGWKWSQDDIPITYRVGDSSPTGMSHDEAVELIEEAYDRWGAIPCSPIDGDDEGETNNEPTNGGFGSNNASIFTFDGGAKNDLSESGTNAAAVTYRYDGQTLTNNGLSFQRARAMNIVFNDGRTWGTLADVDAPDCRGINDFLSTTVHEIGHGLGMAHSCESGDPCADPVLRGATMYYAGGQCENHRRDPNPDDQAGITAIYGPAIDFESPEDAILVGAVPLTTSFEVPDIYGESLYEFDWNFGDGSEHFVSTNPESVTHTWNTEGQFTVTLTAQGNAEECGGDFQTAQRKVGVVLACNAPDPTFTYRNDGEFTVTMENGSRLGAFECVTEFEWVLDGDEDSSLRTFQPTYTFDSAGSHTVVLRAIGPGGEAEFSVDIDVSRQSDEGCNASFAPAGGSIFALLIGALGIRRRRA